MASAIKRGKKATWTARWRDGDKYPQQAGFATKQEAQDYGEEQEALVRQGMRTNPAEMKMTLHEFATRHWAAGVRANAKPRKPISEVWNLIFFQSSEKHKCDR